MKKTEDELQHQDLEANEPLDEFAEMKDLLMRTQANFENYRKQTEKRVDEIRKMAARDVVVSLLEVLDNFEIALKNAPTSEFAEGMKLIEEQLLATLAGFGVTRIASVGERFDPYKHEALMREASESDEGMILEEFSSGYKMHETVLRCARVKISAGAHSGNDTNIESEDAESRDEVEQA